MKEMIYTATSKREWLMHSYYKGVEFVIMSLGTHPTAYIGLMKDNPLYGKDLYKDDFPQLNCNGGITYSDAGIRDESGKLVGTYKWWIGWDYSHSWDYNGLLAQDISYDAFPLKKWTTNEILDEVKTVINEILREQK